MNKPPTGTVTFLFTDIEGSTKMWERDAPVMQEALARHDEILRGAIEGHGGFVFKTVGDAFCAAFDSATDALEATLASQRALPKERWEEGFEIRARMALHTGTVEEQGGDYFGPPVNRVARLLSAGHGGQTLLSLATQELVRDGLADGAELRDLGERRLKDLFHPERVFQLTAPDLPISFPPLKTLDARRNNLPVQPTPLVGREREVGEVAGLLRREEVRLLTLVGPGGTGKTRLSLQAAAELLDEFEGGVFFVGLAPIADPKLVASTIAGVMGVIETPEQPLIESLKAYLRSRELLLVLDNFEQVVDAAPLVGELLSVCPKLRVLVTSRIPLGVYGEKEYAVPPLSLPDPKHPPSVERVIEYEAVRLFSERARDAKAGFSITEENAPAVAEICARLDGLPLAIELAAARVKVLPPKAMLGRLTNRLKLLRGGARDLPERQRTLRAAIGWSHDLLDAEEKTLFARLSVFAGGRTLEAIEAVCDPEGDLDALDGTESMVDKSLIRQEEGPDEEPRFVMLETIHEYAREKLEESGEAEEIKRLHAGHFLSLAEEAEPNLKGPDQVEWLERMEAEHDNFRAALAWSLKRAEADVALRLAGALWWFWYVRGHIAEGRRFLEAALLDEAGSAAIRAGALVGAGRLILEQEGAQKAKEMLEEAVELLGGTQHEEGLAEALHNLGIAAHFVGDFDRGERLFEESLALYQKAGNQLGVAVTIHDLGAAAAFRGNRSLARKCMTESLTISRKIGVKRDIAVALGNLSQFWLTEDLEKARAMQEESLVLARELGDTSSIANNLVNLGTIDVLRGSLESAARLIEESLQISQELNSPARVYDNLVSLAALACARGDDEHAVRVLAVAETLREGNIFPVEPYLSETFPDLYDTHSRIGEAAWSAAWKEGRAMPLEDALAYALDRTWDRPGQGGG